MNETSNDTIQVNEEEEETNLDLGGYPLFSKYHRSLLAKYLTPEIYHKLKDRKTSSGVTLEDVIQSGMSLPYAFNPPRGIGVLAGDAECYYVFAPLLEPIIEEYHNFHSIKKRKNSTRKVIMVHPYHVETLLTCR